MAHGGEDMSEESPDEDDSFRDVLATERPESYTRFESPGELECTRAAFRAERKHRPSAAGAGAYAEGGSPKESCVVE